MFVLVHYNNSLTNHLPNRKHTGVCTGEREVIERVSYPVVNMAQAMSQELFQ